MMKNILSLSMVVLLIVVCGGCGSSSSSPSTSPTPTAAPSPTSTLTPTPSPTSTLTPTPSPTSTPTPTPEFSGISGIITNAANSNQLAGVTVTTDPATSTVTTDAAGNYTISNISPGSYIVTATVGNYAPISVKVDVPSHTIITKNIKLVDKVSMVAWYNFDGNANDSSGNNKHATLVSGAVLAADFLGRANHAYSFDGINDYIAIPDLWGGGHTGLTISAWINTNVLNAAEHVVLFQGNVGGTYLGIGTSNNAYFNLEYDDESGSGINSTNTLTTDTWVHIAGTWYKDTTPDPDLDTFRVYINGVESGISVADTNLLLKAATAGNPNCIGAYAQGNSYFNGKIADIRVYLRTLSAAEIAALAQQ